MTSVPWPAGLSDAFLPSERRAIAPAARLSISGWAEEHRLIVAKDAAEPGPWRNDRAPYLREIMDVLGPDDDVEEIYFQKAARVGGSEAIRNAIGFWADQDPGPMLLTYPTEPAAREQLLKEIIPLFEGSPRLAEQLTGRLADIRRYELELARCSIYIAWAGSPQALATRTIRYALADEVDKFPPFSGREADPLSLLRRRTVTYRQRKKIIAASTPTTRAGAIARAFDGCVDRRFYHVPCPRCGALQRLAWANVRWAPARAGEGKRELAERIEAEGAAWYECSSCRGRIEEREKFAIMLAGVWISDGFPAGEHPPAKRRGYQISALYSQLGIGWAEIAAQFLRACAAREEGDLGPLLEFVTQVLGEPFEDQVEQLAPATLAAKAARGRKPRIVPPWAGLLLSTADTQRDGFYWMTCAWGRGERLRPIDRGRATTFADLERVTLGASYPIEGAPAAARASPARLYIDAGGGGLSEAGDSSRTDEVYRFALARPGIVRPVKGWGGEGRPAALISQRKVNYTPPGAGRSPYDVHLLLLDTQSLKDILAALLATRSTEEDALERLELCEDLDQELVQHLTAERKVAERRGGIVVEMWKRLPGRRCDFWDCLVYQIAAGKIERTDLLPDEFTLTNERMANPKRADAPAPGPFTTPDGRPFLITRRDPR